MKELNSDGCKLIYFIIKNNGPVTPGELKDMVNMPLINIIPHISTLREKNIIHEEEGGYVIT